MIRETERAARENPDSLLSRLIAENDGKADGRTAFIGMRQGDAAATAVVDDYIEMLAEGLANVINCFMPEVIAIGGVSATKATRCLFPYAEKAIERSYLGRGVPQPRIVLAEMGNDAGIIGAAMMAASCLREGLAAERRQAFAMADTTGKNLALLTEYDGSAFSGWQIQSHQRTVQAVLRDAIRQLTREDPRLVGCSRTDAGVHAKGHVSSFHTSSRIPTDRWPLALNSVLPPDISVQAAAVVPDDFNARRDARGKIYSYSIYRPAARPAILRRTCAHVPGRLDLDAMAAALPLLLGRHDFRAFCDAAARPHDKRATSGAAPVDPGTYAYLYVQGDGFLYHMIRILAGTLLEVAAGKLTGEEITAIMESGDRRRAGKTMPPEGLCLEHVLYQPAVFGSWRDPVKEEGEWDVHVALE